MSLPRENIRAGVAPVETWTPRVDRRETFQYVDIGSIDRDSKAIVGATEVDVSDAPSRARQILKANDVLVSTVRPNLNAVAMVPEELDGAIGSTGFTVLRANPQRLLPGFLFYWVRTPEFVAEMVRQATGASYPAVSDRIVLDSSMPMPRVEDQRRIVDVLETADRICCKRRAAAVLSGELFRSVFLDLFGDPVSNPRGWESSTFGAQIEALEYGPRFYNEKYSESGVRIVRITDLDEGGRLDFSGMPKLAVSKQDKAKYVLRPGDVVFARSGATVGKSAVCQEGDPEAIPGAYFIRLRFRDRISPLFAREVLASESVQKIISTRSRQSAQQNFSGPGLRELPLPLPPVELQRRFERFALARRRVFGRQQEAVERSQMLFDALAASAFAGRLPQEGAAA